jgi:cation diffusion facilitator family transporter
MEPNLSASITKHPHPFQLHHDSHSHHSRSSTPRLVPQSATVIDGKGTSTGIEAATDEAEQPFARHPANVAGPDVDMQTIRRYSDSDPYNLQSAFKTEAQLNEIKANTSRKRTGGDSKKGSALRGCLSARDALKARKVEGFYKAQNETIERLLKSVEEHRAEAQQTQGDDHLRHQIAVYGSFAANILLSILQMYGAISSGSLSLFTTMADSIFDPLSNLLLILSHRAVKRVDPNRFPSGKARLETAGNIFFCFMMTAVSLILIAFSAQELATTKDNKVLNDFHLPSILAVAIAFVTKFALFLYCWGIKDKYSQVDILWQDHRNDLLINGFGILTSVGGSKLAWWIDPMGAILLSVLISCIWLRTAFLEFMLLVGVVASVETQRLITYVCVTHSPLIQGIDTVRVYHSGPRLIAEVDIVMDPDATLRDTHDVAEELQFKLEDLPDIERAYVHVDYETTHKPEHFLKKDL